MIFLTLCLRRFEKRHARRVTLIRAHNAHTIVYFLCPRHSKNGGGALSVTHVRGSVRASVRPCVRPLSKVVVLSITFEILH